MVRPTIDGPALPLPATASSTGTVSGDDVDWDTGPLTPALALDDLTDVEASAPNDQDVIVWDDYLQAWVAQAPVGGALALDDLTDVDAPTPADGDVLTWDDYLQAWVAQAPSGGGTFGTPAIVLGTAAAAGSIDEAIRRDATIVAFDATAPVTLDYEDVAAVGSAAVAARRDHVHGMPAAGGGVALSDATPVADGGAGSAGVGTDASRDDHKHPGDAVAIVFVIDGGGSAITTGIKGDLRIPFACTLTGWTLLADQSGAIVIDVWRDTLANYPPTDADALPGAGKEPTITASGTNAEDTTITDWTSDDLSAGDCLRFNVDSVTSIARVTLTLYATRV